MVPALPVIWYHHPLDQSQTIALVQWKKIQRCTRTPDWARLAYLLLVALLFPRTDHQLLTSLLHGHFLNYCMYVCVCCVYIDILCIYMYIYIHQNYTYIYI